MTSASRRPRGIVKINGYPVSFLSAKVESKSHFSCDTWSVKLEAWNQPENYDLVYWADAVDVQIEILFGMLEDGDDVGAAPKNVTSVILGQVDDVSIDPFDEDSLVISGRDLSAQLIDQKTTNKYPDHVSSWIVATIAQIFNLTPQITTTSIPVGQYYNGAYASIARELSYWDLLVYLADQEGFDMYVRGSILYFGPPQADDDKNPLIVSVSNDGLAITSNASKLKLHKSLTMAQDVNVTVISHSPDTGSVKATASRKGKKGAASSGAPEKAQNYTFRKPGLSQQQAQNLANQKLVDITKFERTIEVSMAGDEVLTVQNRCVIQGTKTSFDQSYYIQQITRSLDFEGGFSMSLQCKNTSTEADPAI
jgi:hypothetical protein